MNTTLAIILDLAFLAAFLISIVIAKYAISNNFVRTRFVMSALFIYIVASLTNSYWPYALKTLPYVVPAFLIGMLIGHAVGVRTEQQKLAIQGIEGYMERFAHISSDDMKNLTWWSFVNFYSISCALILINLIGITTVLMHGSTTFVIPTSVVGAALVGSILPYLVHLWMFPIRHLRHSPEEAR